MDDKLKLLKFYSSKTFDQLLLTISPTLSNKLSTFHVTFLISATRRFYTLIVDSSDRCINA